MQNLHGKTLVFDLDGTLVDTAPDLVAATNHALADVGLPPREPRELRPWISFGARRMIEEALRQSGEARSQREIDRLLNLFLSHYEDNIAATSRPFAGAEAAIAVLRSSGARLAICTNKREMLSLKLLDALGLTDSFHAIVGRDTIAVCKPHPDHLREAIRRAEGSPANAVMIGDSEVDVATARAASVPVIGVSFGYSDTPMSQLGPDAVIDSYADLAAALALLQTGEDGSRGWG